MPMTRFTLDRNSPASLTAAERQRLDAMSEEDHQAGAASDADGSLMTDEEWARGLPP
jgi:hypothetical protein